jgi:hypothetical protein
VVLPPIFIDQGWLKAMSIYGDRAPLLCGWSAATSGTRASTLQRR